MQYKQTNLLHFDNTNNNETSVYTNQQIVTNFNSVPIRKIMMVT